MICCIFFFFLNLLIFTVVIMEAHYCQEKHWTLKGKSRGIPFRSSSRKTGFLTVHLLSFALPTMPGKHTYFQTSASEFVTQASCHILEFSSQTQDNPDHIIRALYKATFRATDDIIQLSSQAD